MKETLTNQEKYIRAHKRQHRFIMFSRIFLLIGFLLLWEAAADLKWIDPFFFSSPRLIVLYLYDMCRDGSLFIHTGITTFEVIVSFLLVTFISVGTALALWYYENLAKILEPFLVVLNSLPKSALAPLLIVWLGTGTKTIIIAGMSVAIFGAIINLYTGFLSTEPDKLRLITTLGGTKRDVMFKIILPASYELLLSNMKVNIGLSLVGVIIGEFLAARRGLGYEIIYGTQVFKLDMVISSIFILCAIAVGLYQCIQFLEHRYKKKNSQKASSL